MNFSNHLIDHLFPNSHPHFGKNPVRHEKGNPIPLGSETGNTFHVSTNIDGKIILCVFGMSDWSIERIRESVYYLKDIQDTTREKTIQGKKKLLIIFFIPY